MAQVKIGERVGAILGGDEKEMRFFGYGTYVGDEVPHGSKGFFGEVAVEAGMTNPKIELDSGKVVWGCECWWGPENEIKGMLSKYPNVVEVDIDEIRAKE